MCCLEEVQVRSHRFNVSPWLFVAPCDEFHGMRDDLSQDCHLKLTTSCNDNASESLTEGVA